MKITCYKLTSTTRKSLPRWQALSGTVVSAFDGADTDRKIIHNYPISVNHNQKLMYRSRFAVRTKPIRAEKANSYQCMPQFTNSAEIAAHNKGNDLKSVQDAMLCRRNGKKAFCITSMKSSPYHLIRWISGWAIIGNYGLLSILRGLADRCRLIPALSLHSKEEKGDGDFKIN